MRNGSLKLAIPPGHVDARCLTCQVDVFIPEGTLRCPNGDHDVEPTSLAHLPKAAVLPPVLSLPAEIMPAPSDLLAMAAERTQQVSPPSKETAAKEMEPVVLPDSALAWHEDTVALHTRLVADEARLVEQLRRTRQTRKVLDVVLSRFMLPDLEPSDVVTEIVPVLLEAAASSEQPAPAAPGEKLWAPRAGYAACRNCGTTKRFHGAKGRCTKCTAYFNGHGAELPRDRWDD